MKTQHLVVVVIILFVASAASFYAGRESMRLEFKSRVQEAFKGFPEIEPAATSSPLSATTNPPRVFNEASKEYELPGIKFTIDGFSEETTLIPRFGDPARAKEGTKFVVVSLTVTNTENEQFEFWPDKRFRLVDGQGRKFKTSNDYWQAVSDYIHVRDLGPGIPEKGSLVYEVPEDSVSYHLEEAQK